MISTSPSDEIADFLDFLERMVGSDAVHGRVGAALDDVSLFITLVGVTLPPLYLGYLKEFGENDGILELTEDSDPKLKSLIDFYLKVYGRFPSRLPERAVLIGVGGLGGERCLLYSETGEREEPRVVVNWEDNTYGTLAQTFRNYLYHQAFIRGLVRRGYTLSMYRDGTDAKPEVQQLMLDLGFQSYWFSDDWQGCLERDDGGAVVCVFIEMETQRTTVFGGFRNQRTCNWVEEQLAQQLGLS
jgi:hypothetical protein